MVLKNPAIRQDKAPFNVATKRFARVGYHPSLDPSGCMKKPITKVGPGSYSIAYPTCIARITNEPWRSKLDSEIWSKNLGYNLPAILVERKFRATMGGPAVYTVYDTNPDIFKKISSLQKQNRGFGYDMRFRKLKCEDNNPPPCTYYRNMKLLNTVKELGFNKTPTLEWGPKMRFKDTIPIHHLGPGKFKIRDPESFENHTTKSTSNRRPLDFFTCAREYSSIKNHFAQRSFPEVDRFTILHSDIDYLLTNPRKKKYGKFLKATRWLKKPVVREILNDLSLCYRDPEFPGPNRYNTEQHKSIRAAPESKFPFGQSTLHIRPKTDWKIQPGVGRFNPRKPDCRYKNRKQSWPFLSLSKRGQYMSYEYSAM